MLADRCFVKLWCGWVLTVSSAEKITKGAATLATCKENLVSARPGVLLAHAAPCLGRDSRSARAEFELLLAAAAQQPRDSLELGTHGV